MAKPKTIPSLSFLLTLSLFLSLPNPSLSSPTHTDPFSFIFAGCTQQKYSPNSPYRSNLDSLLSSLLNSATYSSYNNFTVLTSGPRNAIYGLYQCRGDLSMPDCSACVSRSLARLAVVCPDTCGGAVQLGGCFLKYDNASFVGVEDKTVIFKKCSLSSLQGYGNDANAVLTGLGGSGGAFRVGGAGNMQGVAQCTRDLGLQECQDCLSEAIRRLRSDCGAADCGDVFLGKCYARYYVGGAYAYSEAHEKSRNGGEKTFAVIIGLLAGIAILIIFLAFLKRICTEGHGK